MIAKNERYLGNRHRVHRKLLGPAFSIAHLRGMGMCHSIQPHKDVPLIQLQFLVPIFYEVGHKVTMPHTS